MIVDAAFRFPRTKKTRHAARSLHHPHRSPFWWVAHLKRRWPIGGRSLCIYLSDCLCIQFERSPPSPGEPSSSGQGEEPTIATVDSPYVRFIILTQTLHSLSQRQGLWHQRKCYRSRFHDWVWQALLSFVMQWLKIDPVVLGISFAGWASSAEQSHSHAMWCPTMHRCHVMLKQHSMVVIHHMVVPLRTRDVALWTCEQVDRTLCHRCVCVWWRQPVWPPQRLDRWGEKGRWTAPYRCPPIRFASNAKSAFPCSCCMREYH